MFGEPRYHAKQKHHPELCSFSDCPVERMKKKPWCRGHNCLCDNVKGDFVYMDPEKGLETFKAINKGDPTKLLTEMQVGDYIL